MAKKKLGPSFAEIDWNLVDELLQKGNSGVGIASSLGIHFETLYDRCFDKFGKMWSQYSQEKRQKGITKLLAKQYDVAMKGNTTMLIWVGKQMAGQKENNLPIEEAPKQDEINKDHKIMELENKIAQLEANANQSKTE